MKFRNSVSESRIKLNPVPMLNIGFLLFIFYLCTLTDTPSDGGFERRLPLDNDTLSNDSDALGSKVRVRLVAESDGQLSSIAFNGTDLGFGDQAFMRLNQAVLRSLTAARPLGPEIELDRLVEIDPDYHLHYSEIIKAIGACSGGLDQSGVPVRFVSRFNFAERRNP